MGSDAQRTAEQSFSRMLWLLRLGRYFVLAGGLTYFFWEAAHVALGQRPWLLETVVTVFFVSLVAPTLLWLTGSWAERLAQEVTWRYAEIIAINKMAQTVVMERADLASSLNETRTQIRVLQSVNRVLSRSISPLEATDRMLDVALETLGLDAVEVWLTSSDGRGLRQLTHRGLFPDVFRERTQLAVGEGLPGAAAQVRMPVVSCDLGIDRRLERPTLFRAGFASYTAVPLLDQGDQVVGVLGAASRRPKQFSKAEVEALVQLGVGLSSVVRPLVEESASADNAPVIFMRNSVIG